MTTTRSKTSQRSYPAEATRSREGPPLGRGRGQPGGTDRGLVGILVEETASPVTVFVAGDAHKQPDIGKQIQRRTKMSGLMDLELSRQHREEIMQEVAVTRLARLARANHEGKSRQASNLGWELARYARLLSKCLRSTRQRAGTTDGNRKIT